MSGDAKTGIAPDPIIAMRIEAQAAEAIMDGGVASDDEADAAYDRKMAIYKALLDTRASTLEGALLSLEWAIEENEIARRDGVLTFDVIGSLLKGALAVLRAWLAPGKGGAG